MVWNLKQYKISADGGKSWTVQWLHENEAKEMVEKDDCICVLLGGEKTVTA